MESREKSLPNEQASTCPDGGLLHIWPASSPSEQLCPERVLLSTPVLQVSLGEHHGLLLAQGGRVYSFGELSWRDLSIPVSAPVLEASLQEKIIVRVAAGGFHCGVLSEQGGVYMWGENTAGQCGLTDRGTQTNVAVSEPCPVSVVDSEVIPPALVRVTELACGREHSLALSANNELWAWGSGCQLGLVTNTFPVWRPQKVQHLAGKNVIQMACGAYHSLALVRSSSNKEHSAQNATKKKDVPPSFPCTVTEELMTASDAHYCPLGVELSAVTKTETSPRKKAQRFGPGGVSACSSPGSGGSSLLSSEESSSVKQELSAVTTVFEEHQTDTVAQIDFSSKSCLHSVWKSNKSSAPNYELEPQMVLEKLSGHSFYSQQHCSAEVGDTDSQSSHTSDDSFVSSTTSSDQFGSSYRDDSSGSGQMKNNSRQPWPYSSSPVCVEEVRLCLEKEKLTLKGQKSSSLTNIHQKGKAAQSRRRSHPGTPNRGSPQRRCPCACKSSSSLQAKAPEEAAVGLPSLETEVWSWGRGSEGQLGHGDQLPRLQPLCIKSLVGEEVIRVVAGSHHSLALTAQCQVLSWGSNMCGQLGHINSPVSVPQPLKLSEGLLVWDLAAGQSHSLFLADSDCVQPVLLYCGQQPERAPPQGPSLRQRSPNRAESYVLTPCVLQSCLKLGYISSVCSGGQSCSVLTEHETESFICAIHDLASAERRLYCWLSRVRNVLLTPLSNKERISPMLAEPGTGLFPSMCERFINLSALIGRHTASLSYFLQNIQGCDVTLLPLLSHTECFLDSYKKYFSALGDFHVMGGFQALHKLSHECLGPLHTLISRLSVSQQSGGGSDLDLVSTFYWPLQQLHQYSQALNKLAACYHVSTNEHQLLHHCCTQYESMSLSLLKMKKEAEATLQFWKTHSGKNTEALRLPQRRVVCESSNRTLTPSTAKRFSSHWFILFNDALVHTQGAIPSKSFFSTHRIYPLTCLWVKPLTEDGSGLHAIKITCPEESFTLVASTAEEKNKWLRYLNQAVDQVLGGAGQGSSPGVMGMTRTIVYTFTEDERFKDARYAGAWLAGRVHGRGTMTWPDGRTYTGNFKNGLEDGYGSCIMPNKLYNKNDYYQGQWKQGKIHGFGKYSYASGEVYEGCFFDGQRHGYGMLSSGKLVGTSSGVFIGQWAHDMKTGYGVYEDISRGEKHMGLWQEDQRQGSALVVTQCGVYYEGTFKENKMSGPGLLISEDDTVFHGDFCDDWTVNGKGVLSFPNGDCLDGVFSGEWSTGLKVAGVYTKQNLTQHENKKKRSLSQLGQYVVPAALRWICVFDECWGRLGCEGPGRGERQTAWENIAVTITSARRQSPDLSRSQSKALECLEFIPLYAEHINTANYDRMRRYLTKACETPHHPLGWLVETLVTAYRMTYVGVGSVHRLLRQAVQELQAYVTHLYSIIRSVLSITCTLWINLHDTDLVSIVHREGLAVELLRPLEPSFIHLGFAALPCPLAQGPAWGDGLFQHRAHRRVYGAKEELQIGRALGLDQRVELLHLQPRVLLVHVAQQVWHDDLAVGDVGAQRDGDGLADAVFRDRDPALAVVVLSRNGFLFPGLPEDGGIIPEAPAAFSQSRTNANQAGDLVVSGCSLLLPLLLPRLYTPLFTLYCLPEDQEENHYWTCILQLNKHPDQTLLSSLEVHEKFWPRWMSILGEEKQIVSSSKDACFVSAVETLQQISSTFTPSDKLLVIQKTFEELTLEVKQILDDDVLWCMDDLFPLFLYVVVRARIKTLGAEVCLIEDLMDPNIQHGELGLMLTTLKACYFQIQQESAAQH
ncbi:alsin-like isoform X2 [Gouania willdenowi]|uniref:alsin-like isoform X2 n=1 Tax=Gouania willdenowi TaxID=441366 RepID=UPI001055CAF0|nr:alsin-like isoform X2 [Gouania willdenowi]